MSTREDVQRIADQLRRIDSLAIEGNVSRHFLEIEKSADGREIRINGNMEGLIHFATAVLDVATKAIEGAHHHFDESGMVDRADVSLVVRLKAAVWEEKPAP